MFRTVPLSIIRSFALYTQQWYMSHRFADSLREESGSRSCSQAVSTTCMTYTIAVCTVQNSWWWAEELSETWTVLFQKSIWEISASSWLYYKNTDLYQQLHFPWIFDFMVLTMSEKWWYNQRIPCSTNQKPRDLRLASRSRWELRYIPGYCAASSGNSTCSSNYLGLQVSQSQCLRVIDNQPRHTPTSHLHPAHPRSHPPPYWQILRSLPLTPQPTSPTNKELCSSRPD